MKLTAFSVWEVASHFVDLAVAYGLAAPIGWDREQEERSAGIRTFPLVAVAACGFVLIAIRVLGAESTGQARILEGVITGVGFIGGGLLLLWVCWKMFEELRISHKESDAALEALSDGDAAGGGSLAHERAG